MKVLYVFSSTNFSGAEIVLERLISNNSNVEPLVLCPEGKFHNILVQKGIKVITNNNLASLNRRHNTYSKFQILLKVVWKFYMTTFHVLRILLFKKIRFVHSNNLTASSYLLPSIFLTRIFTKKIKFLWSNHDLIYPDGAKMDKIADLCVKWFNHTLVVSNAVRNKFLPYSDKVSVLYNGLDTCIFCFSQTLRDQFRQENAIKDNTFVIGIAGLIIERKGLHILLEAFEKISNIFNHVLLIICGSFLDNEIDYKNKIVELVKRLPNNKIMLLNNRSDMVSLYCGIDLLINATISKGSEPLGTTIYEAMACERIVIASDTGGTPEIVTNGVDGYTFQADNSKALAEIMESVILSYGNLENIRHAARKKVLEMFTIEIAVRNYNKFLQSK